MFGRLTSVQFAPDRLEAGLAQARELKAAMLQMDGCKEMYLLVDRKTGKGVALSLWESEEKLRAAETTVNQRRDQAAQAGGATAPAISEVFEVLE